mmetsp:Transcript_99456/g.281677  ORF Transcript_99456/g.281677 Transcript_99456/m.281677 type:complete len:375 (-) Transcript_99456:500-1624(-)
MALARQLCVALQEMATNMHHNLSNPAVLPGAGRRRPLDGRNVSVMRGCMTAVLTLAPHEAVLQRLERSHYLVELKIAGTIAGALYRLHRFSWQCQVWFPLLLLLQLHFCIRSGCRSGAGECLRAAWILRQDPGCLGQVLSEAMLSSIQFRADAPHTRMEVLNLGLCVRIETAELPLSCSSRCWRSHRTTRGTALHIRSARLILPLDVMSTPRALHLCRSIPRLIMFLILSCSFGRNGLTRCCWRAQQKSLIEHAGSIWIRVCRGRGRVIGVLTCLRKAPPELSHVRDHCCPLCHVVVVLLLLLLLLLQIRPAVPRSALMTVVLSCQPHHVFAFWNACTVQTVMALNQVGLNPTKLVPTSCSCAPRHYWIFHNPC